MDLDGVSICGALAGVGVGDVARAAGLVDHRDARIRQLVRNQDPIESARGPAHAAARHESRRRFRRYAAVSLRRKVELLYRFTGVSGFSRAACGRRTYA